MASNRDTHENGSRAEGARSGEKPGLLRTTRRGVLQGAAAFGALCLMVGNATAHTRSNAEFGSTTVDQPEIDKWYSVSLDHNYDDPVVIMKPASYDGGQPCHVRLQNVGSGGFEFKLEEWAYLDGTHIPETLHYIAIDKGKHGEFDASVNVHAGHVETDEDIAIATSLHNNPPIVLAQPQTYRDNDPVVSRVSNVTADGSNSQFAIRLQEEEAQGGHLAERIGYVAIEPRSGFFFDIPVEAGRTANVVTNQWHRINFAQAYTTPRFLADIQTFDGVDTAGVRYRNLTSTGVEVKIEEEQSNDQETFHTSEEVGYFVVDGAKQLLMVGDAETGTERVRQTDSADWHQVSFLQSYNDPVVIMKPASYDGGQPCHVRLRDVGSGGFEFKLEEWAYLDGSHIPETLHYIAIEKGKHGEFNFEPNIHAGFVEADEEFVIGTSYHNNRPVVLAQPQTYRDGDPVVSRVADVTTDGSNSQFTLRLQEEEAQGGHLAERIGYIAVSPGTEDFNRGGTRMEAGRTSNVVTNQWHRINFARTYTTPRFLADMQTFDGADTAGVRYRNLTSTGVEVKIEEEQSNDLETYHISETVGYLVIEGT